VLTIKKTSQPLNSGKLDKKKDLTNLRKKMIAEIQDSAIIYVDIDGALFSSGEAFFIPALHDDEGKVIWIHKA
jgi:hypothetical protein